MAFRLSGSRFSASGLALGALTDSRVFASRDGLMEASTGCLPASSVGFGLSVGLGLSLGLGL